MLFQSRHRLRFPAGNKQSSRGRVGAKTQKKKPDEYRPACRIEGKRALFFAGGRSWRNRCGSRPRRRCCRRFAFSAFGNFLFLLFGFLDD